MADTFAFAHAVFHVVLLFAIHAGRTQRGQKRREPRPGIPLRLNPQPAPVIKQGRQNSNSTTQTKGNPMKPVLRYQSQLLFRKSYKPSRVIRIRPAKLNFIFRPVRFGLKPQIKTYEC